MTLTINNLTKRYKEKPALDNVSLTLQPTTIYALLGNNGAGKSTLLNIINNRIFASSGQGLRDGERLTDNSARLRHVYLMSEDNMFPANMKVSRIFTFSEQVYGSFDWDLADRLIASFDLDTSLRFHKLSTGYRTITKLIAGLCVPVDYLFLDEPVLGLDAPHREVFYEYLMETFNTRPRTILVSTHLIEEIANLIETVIVIDHGHILLESDADTLAHAGHEIAGEQSLVDSFAASSGVKILGSKEITGHKVLYVDGTLPGEIPAGITVAPMGLQDYFIHYTTGMSTLFKEGSR